MTKEYNELMEAAAKMRMEEEVRLFESYLDDFDKAMKEIRQSSADRLNRYVARLATPGVRDHSHRFNKNRAQRIDTAPHDREIILLKVKDDEIIDIDIGGWEIYAGRDDPNGFDLPFADWTSNRGIEEPMLIRLSHTGARD